MITDILSNFSPGHEFAAYCPLCDRHFVVPSAALEDRLGGNTPVIVAMRKVTCRQCGARASVNRGYTPQVR